MTQEQQLVRFDEYGREIDLTTGEVQSPFNGRQLTTIKEPIAAMFETDVTPIHVRKMQELNISPDVYSSYVGVPWVDVAKYINKTVRVIGAIAWFSGSFTSKDDGELKDGYYKILMKIAEEVKEDITIDREVVEVKRNVIIATSSKKVAELMAGFMQVFGWYDWKPGTVETIVFTGDKDQGYMARTLGDLKPQRLDKTSAR
jgi:hypothetical protein